jgi:hypothetical protein
MRAVSRYEQEKLQLQEKIQKLQEISIADKPWTLLGEAFSLSLSFSLEGSSKSSRYQVQSGRLEVFWRSISTSTTQRKYADVAALLVTPVCIRVSVGGVDSGTRI